MNPCKTCITEPGLKLSTTTSAHLINFVITSVARGYFRSIARLYLSDITNAKELLRFNPGILSLKGVPTLVTFGYFDVPIMITVVPWVARLFASIGPTPAVTKPTTFNPVSAFFCIE